LNSLLYIHGFNSSERSHKALVLSEAMAEIGKAGGFLSPRLPWQPTQAIALLEEIIGSYLETHGAGTMTLVGSSLGGFYACYLAEKFQIKAVLVNPAMQAPRLLVDHVGAQYNPYTDEHYELTHEHMDELSTLVISQPTPERYWLMLQEGDEVLDYRAALSAFPQIGKLTCEANGDHRFIGFERFASDILHFAGIKV